METISFEECWNLFFKNDGRILPKSISGYNLNLCNCANSLIAINDLPDRSIDLILTDPPFAIKHGKKKTITYNRNSNKVMEGYNEVSSQDYSQFSENWILPAFKKLTKYGILIIISGWSNQKDILNAIDKAGFYLTNQIIWKMNFGVFTKKKMVSAHYNIFVCTKHKTKFKFNKILWYPEDVFQSHVEIWEIKREYWKNKVKTPNKLPKELVEMLISMYSDQNDLICDLFSGSGTILKVANYMNRNCLAFDIVQDYVDFANYRLKNLEY